MSVEDEGVRDTVRVGVDKTAAELQVLLDMIKGLQERAAVMGEDMEVIDLEAFKAKVASIAPATQSPEAIQESEAAQAKYNEEVKAGRELQRETLADLEAQVIAQQKLVDAQMRGLRVGEAQVGEAEKVTAAVEQQAAAYGVLGEEQTASVAGISAALVLIAAQASALDLAASAQAQLTTETLAEALARRSLAEAAEIQADKQATAAQKAAASGQQLAAAASLAAAEEAAIAVEAERAAQALEAGVAAAARLTEEQAVIASEAERAVLALEAAAAAQARAIPTRPMGSEAVGGQLELGAAVEETISALTEEDVLLIARVAAIQLAVAAQEHLNLMIRAEAVARREAAGSLPPTSAQVGYQAPFQLDSAVNAQRLLNEEIERQRTLEAANNDELAKQAALRRANELEIEQANLLIEHQRMAYGIGVEAGAVNRSVPAGATAAATAQPEGLTRAWTDADIAQQEYLLGAGRFDAIQVSAGMATAGVAENLAALDVDMVEGRYSVDALSSSFLRLGMAEADSSNAMRKHGALTTEYISALARGETTINEFGYQMTATIGKFAGWAGAAALTYGALGAVYEFGKGAVDAASSVQQLTRTIPNLNRSQANTQLQDVSAKTNTSMAETGNAVFLASRTFHTMAEATTAAGIALSAYKLDGVQVTQTLQAMTAIHQQFGVSAQGMGAIFDQLAVGQREFNARITDQIPLLLKSASAVKLMGGNLHDLIVLSTLALRTTSLPGSQVGTALARSAANFLNPTTTKGEADRSAVKALGINVDQGYTEIVLDAIRKATTLSGTKKLELSEALFGPLRGGLAAGLFSSTDANKILTGSAALLPQVQKQETPVAVKGALAGELAKELQSPKQELESFIYSLERLGAALANTGAFTAVEFAFKQMLGVVDDVRGLVNAFDGLSSGTKTLISTLIEARLAMLFFTRTRIGASAVSALPGFKTISGFTRNLTGGETAKDTLSRGDVVTGVRAQLEGLRATVTQTDAQLRVIAQQQVVAADRYTAAQAKVVEAEQAQLGLTGQAERDAKANTVALGGQAAAIQKEIAELAVKKALLEEVQLSQVAVTNATRQTYKDLTSHKIDTAGVAAMRASAEASGSYVVTNTEQAAALDTQGAASAQEAAAVVAQTEAKVASTGAQEVETTALAAETAVSKRLAGYQSIVAERQRGLTAALAQEDAARAELIGAKTGALAGVEVPITALEAEAAASGRLAIYSLAEADVLGVNARAQLSEADAARLATVEMGVAGAAAEAVAATATAEAVAAETAAVAQRAEAEAVEAARVAEIGLQASMEGMLASLGGMVTAIDPMLLVILALPAVLGSLGHSSDQTNKALQKATAAANQPITSLADLPAHIKALEAQQAAIDAEVNAPKHKAQRLQNSGITGSLGPAVKRDLGDWASLLGGWASPQDARNLASWSGGVDEWHPGGTQTAPAGPRVSPIGRSPFGNLGGTGSSFGDLAGLEGGRSNRSYFPTPPVDYYAKQTPGEAASTDKGLRRVFDAASARAIKDATDAKDTQAGRDGYYADLRKLEVVIQQYAASHPGRDTATAFKRAKEQLQADYVANQARLKALPVDDADPFAQFEQLSPAQVEKQVAIAADYVKVFGAANNPAMKTAIAAYIYLANKFNKTTNPSDSDLQAVATAQGNVISVVEKGAKDLLASAAIAQTPAGVASDVSAAMAEIHSAESKAISLTKKIVEKDKGKPKAIAQAWAALNQLLTEWGTVTTSGITQLLTEIDNATSLAQSQVQGSSPEDAVLVGQKGVDGARRKLAAALATHAGTNTTRPLVTAVDTLQNAQNNLVAANQLALVQAQGSAATAAITGLGPAADTARAISALAAARHSQATILSQHLGAVADSNAQAAVNSAIYSLNQQELTDSQSLASEAASAISANASLAEAQTLDPVKQAQIKLAADIKTLGTILRKNYADESLYLTALTTQRATIASDAVAKQQAGITAETSTLAYQYQVEQIGGQQYINALEKILKTKKMALSERQSLEETIYGLKTGSGNLDLNVGKIKVPSAYEIRRAIGLGKQGAIPGAPSTVISHTSNITVNVYGDKNARGQVFAAMDQALHTTVRVAARAKGVL